MSSRQEFARDSMQEGSICSSGTAEAVFGLVWLVVSSHGAPTGFMVGVREHYLGTKSPLYLQFLRAE
jgi:hypothetical protein